MTDARRDPIRSPDPREQDFDIVSTGWLRLLPEPAFEALGALMLLRQEPVAGDLDDLHTEDLLHMNRFGGLDTPYQPPSNIDADEEAMWSTRWEWLGTQAASRGFPMRTPRDAITFMSHVGLVERIEAGGEVFWQSVSPIPLAEDVLTLTEQERQDELALRWHDAFAYAEERIVTWLLEHSSKERAISVRCSVAELAVRLDLDIESARHGLANATRAADGIACDPPPENANPGDALTVTVDWQRFDDAHS
jgi:hypothetical protein